MILKNLIVVNRVKPKKFLGQHFLKDENVAVKIVEALPQHQPNATLIEIGPGTGVLTKYLIRLPDINFLALEVDRDAIPYLKATYPDHEEQFLLLDFLQYDLKKLKPPLSIIGNLPYNISSQIFFKVWDNRDLVEHVVCMIQKEVADRICSKEGSKVYGILSVLLQAFYDIEYLFTVPPQVFYPPPRVQSAVIRLKRNQITQLPCDEIIFRKVVKMAFGKRRKTLRNALKDLNLDAQITNEKVFDLRAEQLSVEEFIDLTLKISS